MPISRYESPARQNVQNTYVPLPYAELAHSLAIKQNEYDLLKQTTEQADKEIMGIKVPEFIRTSTDYSPTGTIENPHVKYLRQNQEAFAQEKEELLNSGIDFTTPEGKKAVSQYVNKVATFRNTAGRQIEQDATNIFEHNKNFDEYLKKGSTYQGNAYYADRNVDKFLQQGRGFETTSLNPYQERTKVVGEALEKMKSQVTRHVDKNGLVTLRDRNTGTEVATIQNGRLTWKGVSGERVKGALQGVVDSELDQGIQREALSYRDFLLGKNSDKIFNEKGDIKNVTYKTKDSKGKEIEITEPADKFYYNKKYNELKKDLENYAINTFVSSDVESSQSNRLLPDAYQGVNSPTNIPVTVTPDANVTQTSSSTPAKDALSSFNSLLKRTPVVVHGYGGGRVEGKYENLTKEEKANTFKADLLSSIADPNDKKKAQVLLDKIYSQAPSKDNLEDLANSFDKQWNNVNANIKVNLKPTKTSINAGNAITDFIKRTASGSLVTDQRGKETSFDSDKDYIFAGAVLTDKGVVFNMADKKNPTDVIQVQNESDFGANSLVVNRSQLKQIDNTGDIRTSPLLSGIAHLYPTATSYRVVADPNSPTLSSVVMLDSTGKQVDEPVPQDVLDEITIEAVAQSMGSVGTGVTPKFK